MQGHTENEVASVGKQPTRPLTLVLGRAGGVRGSQQEGLDTLEQWILPSTY